MLHWLKMTVECRMALATSPMVPIETTVQPGVTPAARLRAMRAMRPSTLVGLVLIALLGLFWGLFAWFVVEQRRDALEHAQGELTSWAQAYAELAAAVVEPDSVVAGAAPLEPMVDRARLDAARAALAPPPGASLRLWRVADGRWLAGDPARSSEAPPFAPPRDGAGPAGHDGDRLVAVAIRAGAGLMATADRATRDALTGWRRATLTEVAGLGGLSLIAALLGLLLVRQLDRRVASDARWRALIEHTDDGVFLIRVEPAPGAPADRAEAIFRFEAVNPAGVTFWGARLAPNDLIGRDVRDVLPPETCDQVLAQYRACVTSGEPRRYQVVSPAGTFVREAVAVPLRDGPQGAVTRLVVTTRDVTEQQRRRRALDHALLRAEEASRAKTEFLANTSHELRTPLNAVIGYADLLTSGIAGPLAPKQADYVGCIHQSGQHLLEIISDILDLAKVEAGRLELHDGIAAPREIAESCATLMTERIEISGLRLAIDCAAGLPQIRVDATRLKQALVNLLSNAAKFTPRGGLIGLVIRRTAPGGIAFTVSDTGPGMTADEIARALETFGQVDSGLERRHDGAGLGLPLARRLTELHGGTLDIDSAKGRGTTVIITLPPARVAEDQQVPAA
jgi:signal transduction histidine kinase